MAKVLYWHLTPDEVAGKEYPIDKLIHWEIRLFFDERSYISIFWFKEGVPFDKEPINGIAMYGYEIVDSKVEEVKDYLHEQVGGEVLRRSHRIFFEDSKRLLDNKSIAELANMLKDRFNAIVEIWLEFDGIDEKDAKKIFKKPLIIEK